MNMDAKQLIAAHRSGAVLHPATGKTTGITGSGTAAKQADRPQFSQLLQSHIDNVRFSSHAATRMKSRNIEMTSEMMGKLEKAVDGAAQKGARDSLILMKNYAFIVNIPNRTVVTAMDGAGLKDNIFTNIDSAVVAE
jgi:flagellar operon protein